MAVVDWNEIITKETATGIHAQVRREFTVASTAEIADIDTTECLQGSIVLDISTGKMHVWDGTAWVEQ